MLVVMKVWRWGGRDRVEQRLLEPSVRGLLAICRRTIVRGLLLLLVWVRLRRQVEGSLLVRVVWWVGCRVRLERRLLREGKGLHAPAGLSLDRHERRVRVEQRLPACRDGRRLVVLLVNRVVGR